MGVALPRPGPGSGSGIGHTKKQPALSSRLLRFRGRRSAPASFLLTLSSAQRALLLLLPNASEILGGTGVHPHRLALGVVLVGRDGLVSEALFPRTLGAVGHRACL